MVIIVQKIVECNLIVNSEIDGKHDSVTINGKGYYKNDNKEIIIYFSSNENKYKYLYKDNKLYVFSNDSCYEFSEKNYSFGEIKNGDFSLKITTFASKIEIYSDSIVLDYTLSQQDTIIGKYNSILSFK